MPRDGTATRTAILDAAEALILESGFSAASVDRVIAAAGITKGSFFYHFDSKAALARAVIDRFAALDEAKLDETLRRADALSDDPRQRMLAFVGLLQEEMAGLTEPYPGCLFASYCAEAGLFDEATLQVVRDSMILWRDRLGKRFAEIARRHPPRIAIDPASLADLITVVFEGAFILSRTLREPQAVARQLAHYRNYLELLFPLDAQIRG